MLSVNALEELFIPGSRHVHEERKRLEYSRDDATVGGPGCGPIDLDSGKVVVTLPTEGVLPPRPRVEEEPGEA